jgi:hypothetical protein
MSITHKYILTPAAESLTGFASNVTGATWTLSTNNTTDGLAHQVSIRNDSATNHSAKTATLVGLDADGYAQTEVMNLPGASATVESTKYFKRLTSITPSATIGADTMDIGWVDEIASPTICLNHPAPNGAAFQVDITGTINYTVQVTAASRELYAGQESLPWMATTTAALVGATADKFAVIEPGAVFARLITSSYSTGATASVYVSETWVA